MTTTSGAGEALAEALGAALRARGQTTAESYAALHADLSAASWWDLFHLGVSGSTDVSVAEALSAGEQFGACLAPPPVLATAGLLAPLLSLMRDHGPLGPSLRKLLDSGQRIAVAVPVSTAGNVQASRQQSGLLLNGRVERLLDPGASHALLRAEIDGVPAIVAIALERAGVVVTRHDAVVLGHQTASLDLRAVSVTDEELVLDPEGAMMRHAATVFSLLLDAHAVGIAATCLARSVDYSLMRRQFGRPIGAFQAVQHLVAEIDVAVETSRSVLLSAATAFASKDPDAVSLVAASRLHCSASAKRACEIAIQVHGGLGFTWELGLHHFYRAALFSRHYLTDEGALRGELATVIRRRAEEQIEAAGGAA